MAEGWSGESRLDRFVIALLVVMLAMLFAALSGVYRVFGYALLAFLGMLMGLGFVRRGDRRTWGPPITATAVLLIAFTGMFLNEGISVSNPSDTRLGFQPGTAFLVYGVWVPAFFTMGLSLTLMFDRLACPDRAAAGAAGAPPASLGGPESRHTSQAVSVKATARPEAGQDNRVAGEAKAQHVPRSEASPRQP